MILNAYELNLPKLSNFLTNKLITVANSFQVPEVWNPNTVIGTRFESSISYHESTKTLGSTYNPFLMPLDLQNEIQQEMTDELLLFSQMKFYFQIVSGGNTLCPHVDGSRTLVLLYNISGDGAYTNFHDKLIIDDEKLSFAEHEVSQPIETHKFEPYRWYILNPEKVHSVTNVSKKRIAIVTDTPDKFEDFYNYCKNKMLIKI